MMSVITILSNDDDDDDVDVVKDNDLDFLETGKQTQAT